MSTRKTVRLRRREIEERHWPRALEREFQCDIQKCRASHRYREELRLAFPLPHHKADYDKDRSGSQRYRRADKREPAHDRRHERRGELMDQRSRRVIKPARVTFECFVRDPAEKD